jgi:hypothetical protein
MSVDRRTGVRIAAAIGTLATLAAISTSGIGNAQGRQAARTADARIAQLEATVKSLTERLQAQEDIEAIYRLTRAYGYYVDKAQWSDVAALWAEKDSSVEIAARGVYLGRAGAERLFKASMGGGQDGLREGQLFNHMLLQGVVNVDPGGKTAKGRWRAWVQIGSAPLNGKPGNAAWSEGTYENEYVKENGVWMFKKMKFWPTFYTPYDKGWGVQVNPNNRPDQRNPPDLPKSDDADVLPKTFVPPYHYPNPVSGKAWVAPPPRTTPPAAPTK